jgi:hypothetical protein
MIAAQALPRGKQDGRRTRDARYMNTTREAMAKPPGDMIKAAAVPWTVDRGAVVNGVVSQ